MTTTLEWQFPLPRTHTGVPLGNGRTGLLLWGSDNRLCITIGRADLWDHRGGMPWTERQNYAHIRQMLEARDEAGIRETFRPARDLPPGTPSKPTVLPFGRIELALPSHCVLEHAHLAIGDGVATVVARDGRERHALEVLLHPEEDIALVRSELPVGVSAVTSWDLMGERLAALGHAAPTPFPTGEVIAGGWYWGLPADAGAFAAWSAPVTGSEDHTFALAVGRSTAAAEAETTAGKRLSAADPLRIEEETVGWWKRYWRGVARVSVPNPILQEIHDYGLYLFAGLTNPAGVAATLQGPWIEEYDFPPWSSDYHFNINVQMCYSPALRSGLAHHMTPLFELIQRWSSRLVDNARMFVGADDGRLLPHAVDDTAMCMGTFWTGTIDHACTAWVAQMMYDFADYTGNIDFLRDVAYPFMRGTFAVYRSMLEEDGASLRMPVSVSPEYRGAAMNAWGANASFQLAALHRLCENLQDAAATLRLPADPAWADVRNRLPKATLIGAQSHERIALWEGVDLEESHRHHSHLAGLTPFDTISAEDPEWSSVVERSLSHWIAMGMGLWSGWCMSWGSQIHSRVGNGAGAELVLELWKRVFTNEGRASMHDAVSNGVTVMGAPPVLAGLAAEGSRGSSTGGSTTGGILEQAERMQMDGAMGGVAAVQEMLMHSRRGKLYVFPALPEAWPSAEFRAMHAPGGFVVSGTWDRTAGWQISITATRDGALELVPPAGTYEWRSDTADGTGSGALTLDLRAQERLTVVSGSGE